MGLRHPLANMALTSMQKQYLKKSGNQNSKSLFIYRRTSKYGANIHAKNNI